MNGHVELILFLSVGTCLLAGLALLWEWRIHREPAAGWWGLAFVSSATGACLFPLRALGHLDLLSIGISNALFILSYCAIAAGVATFLGRRASLLVIAAPSAAWLVFWGIAPQAADFDTRVVVMSAVTACLSACTAWIAVSANAERLIRALGVVMVLRTGFFAVRCLWASEALGALSDPQRGFGFQIVVIEGVWTSVLLGYLMLAALREKRDTALLKLAETDFLTGASNRRCFQVSAEGALRQMPTRGVAILMMLDLDNFKRINDACGHAFGDTVLQRFAEIVRERLGRDDIFARLGGEEFAVMIRGDADASRATALAESIRADFQRAMLGAHIAGVSPTVSIGIAASHQARTLETLLALADRALYQAKANGRNRVEHARTEFPAPDFAEPARGHDTLLEAG